MANRPFTFMCAPAIRDAAPGDAGALAALIGDAGSAVTPEVIWARIEKMASLGQHTLVAQIDDRVVGFIGFSFLPLYESDTPVCWIMALAVSVPFRRHGVGRALIQAVERWCAGKGLPAIGAGSDEGRGDAQGFFEACGFSHAGLRFRKAVPN